MTQRPSSLALIYLFGFNNIEVIIMYTISTHVDWLSYTVFGLPEPDNVHAAEAIAEHLYLQVTGDDIPPSYDLRSEPHYRYVFVYPDGLRVRVGDKRTGCNIVLPSRAITAYYFTPERMYRLIKNDPNAKPTRIDYAVDLRGADAQACLADLASVIVNDRRKSTVWRQAKLITAVCIGSRKSGVYCRVYDKGIETGTGGDWLRVECEYKGSMALPVADNLSRLEYVYSDVLARIKTRPDNKVYDLLLESATVDVVRLPAFRLSPENYYDYLNRVIKPYVINRCSQDPDYFIDTLREMLNNVIKITKGSDADQFSMQSIDNWEV